MARPHARTHSAETETTGPDRPRVPVRVLALAALATCALLPTRTAGARGVDTAPRVEERDAARASANLGDETFDGVHAAARARYVEALLGLATWSADAELYAERDRLYRAVIELEPDNPAARKGLRYSRKSDGSWQEPAPREAKNRNPKALPALAERRRVAVEPYRTALLSACDRFTVDAAVRARVLDECLLGDPDDAPARAARGEVRANDAWVLRETAAGRERRLALHDALETARTAVGDVWKVEPTELEAGFGVNFTSRLGSRTVRVLGTTPTEEGTAILRAVAVVPALLATAFHVQAPLEDGYVVYVLASPKENGPLVAHLPGIDEAFRSSLRACVGAKLPGLPIVVTWDETKERRIDNATRSALNGQLGVAFGLDLRVGWAWEGMGLYLNREITGTRLTWFTQPGSASKADGLRKRLMTTDANWMQEALTVLQRDGHPSLAAVLARDVNTLTTEEMLIAYVFAAYLVEGRADDVPRVLERVGRGGEASAVVVPQVLGADLPTIEARLVRWLTERR